MAVTASQEQIILQRPANKALDYAFTDAIITEVIKKHYPQFATITKLRHVKHKRRINERNSTFIYSYYVHGVRRDGRPIVRHLVYSCHSDGSREKAFNVLTKLIDAGFNTDNYRVIVPLEYYREIQTIIYEAVRGNTLLYYMEQRTPVTDLANVLRHTANWTRKFHTFKLPPKYVASIPPTQSANMNWRIPEVIPSVVNANAEQGTKLEAFWSAFTILEKELTKNLPPLLVYGDLHPENIITHELNTDHLTMIDFTDVTRGNQLRDVGSFIQQVEFMARSYYSPEDMALLRRRFVEYYFQTSIQNVKADDIARVNLYQAWNALRGFVYFFFNPETQKESYGLLEDAWRYLTLAQHREQTIAIKY